MLRRVGRQPPGILAHSWGDFLLTVRTDRGRLLLLNTGLIRPDADSVRQAAILRIPNIVIHIELDLLSHQCGCLGVTKQFPQRLPVGGVDNQGPYLHDAGHPLFGEGKYILVLLAALEGHGTVPQTGDGKHRLHTVIDVFSAQVLGLPHLAKALIALQLAKFIFGHHSSVTSSSSESVTLVAISCRPLSLHLAYSRSRLP